MSPQTAAHQRTIALRLASPSTEESMWQAFGEFVSLDQFRDGLEN